MTSKQAIKLLKRYGNDQENVMELYKVIEDEIADLKHNYKAIDAMYNNSVAYATKIQNNYNELKHDMKRYFELLHKYNISIIPTDEDCEDLNYLEDILSKVGKEKWHTKSDKK